MAVHRVPDGPFDGRVDKGLGYSRCLADAECCLWSCAQNGMASFCGSPLEVLESGALDIDFLTEEQAKDDDDDDKARDAPGSSSLTVSVAQLGNNVVNDDDDSSATTIPVKEKNKLIEVEGKADGALTKEVYLNYFRVMGKSMFWIVFLSGFFASQTFKPRPKSGFASGLPPPKMKPMLHFLPLVLSPQSRWSCPLCSSRSPSPWRVCRIASGYASSSR